MSAHGEPPAGADPGTCNGPNCRAPIFWVRMVSGMLMPIDAKPVRIILLDGDSMAEARYRFTQGWTPHWATCPDSKTFRRD